MGAGGITGRFKRRGAGDLWGARPIRKAAGDHGDATRPLREEDGSGRWARPVSGVRVMRGEGSWQVGPTGEATRGDGLLRERGGGRPAAWAVGEVGVGRRGRKEKKKRVGRLG